MPASPRAAQATPRDNALPVVATSVAMAVGVLMHRYSLTRAVALERLQRHAQAEGAPLVDHAERLLQAVELLANSGQG
jgi:response regulator NasT